MKIVFILVRDLLIYFSKLTNRSYNETNIIIYYYTIPFIYLVIFDYKLDMHIFKLVFLIAVLISLMLIQDFTYFSDQLFVKSVKFLKSFQILGWDYIVSSVIICVIVPIILLLIILLYF